MSDNKANASMASSDLDGIIGRFENLVERLSCYSNSIHNSVCKLQDFSRPDVKVAEKNTPESCGSLSKLRSLLDVFERLNDNLCESLDALTTFVG
jgi:hypothetical protein